MMGRKLGYVAVLLACSVTQACGDDDDGGGSGGSSGAGAAGGSAGAAGSSGTGGAAGSSGTGGAGGSAGAGGASGGAGSGGASGASGSAGAGGGAGAAGAGGAAGAAGSSGAAGAAGSANDKSCEKLNEDYVKAIVAAKKCVYGTSPNPCSIKVKGDLDCQCPTFINPANTSAVAELTKIEAAWTAKACLANPGCLCADPATGACYAGAGGPADGNCHDG